MRIKASIRLSGDNLDADALTRIVGRVPDVARETGKQYAIGNTGKNMTQPTGVWSIRSPLAESSSVSEHTEWCLEQLEALPLKRLEDHGVEKIDVFYGVFDESGNFGFELAPEQMRRLAKCGAIAGFDIYS